MDSVALLGGTAQVPMRAPYEQVFVGLFVVLVLYIHCLLVCFESCIFIVRFAYLCYIDGEGEERMRARGWGWGGE